MVLNNKLGIKNSLELARFEEKISKKRALESFEKGLFERMEAGKFYTLAEIHKYLFSDIYEFAGVIRNVDLAKGSFKFAPVMYLEVTLKNIEKMKQSTYDDIIEKYVEMNIAHPFREGNGRSMRIWLDLMLKKELHQVVDWSLVDKNDYLLGMNQSPIKDFEIKQLLRGALTHDINDKMIYMKSIDASYFYEGFAAYKMNEIK